MKCATPKESYGQGSICRLQIFWLPITDSYRSDGEPNNDISMIIYREASDELQHPMTFQFRFARKGLKTDLVFLSIGLLRSGKHFFHLPCIPRLKPGAIHSCRLRVTRFEDSYVGFWRPVILRGRISVTQSASFPSVDPTDFYLLPLTSDLLPPPFLHVISKTLL
jgi:hypothetical protein